MTLKQFVEKTILDINKIGGSGIKIDVEVFVMPVERMKIVDGKQEWWQDIIVVNPSENASRLKFTLVT